MSDAEIESGLDKSTVDDGQRHEPRKAINATNWSLGLKIYHTAIPCFLAFLM
jgi:hypothetical protein